MNIVKHRVCDAQDIQVDKRVWKLTYYDKVWNIVAERVAGAVESTLSSQITRHLLDDADSRII